MSKHKSGMENKIVLATIAQMKAHLKEVTSKQPLSWENSGIKYYETTAEIAEGAEVHWNAALQEHLLDALIYTTAEGEKFMLCHETAVYKLFDYMKGDDHNVALFSQKLGVGIGEGSVV